MLKRKKKTEAPLAKEEEAASIAITALDGPAGNFWYFFVGGAVLAAIAIMAGALLMQFFEERPVNLTYHTDYLVDKLETALQKQYIPGKNIKTGPPREGRLENQFWHVYRIEIDLPTHISAEGLTELVREAMLSYFVEVAEQPATGPDRELTLSLGNISFAQLVLHAAPENVAFPKTDVRPMARRIADELHKQLLDDGIPAAMIERHAAVEKEDKQTRWVYTLFELTIPESIGPEVFSENLQAFADQYDVRVTRTVTAKGVHEYILVFGARPCVELHCTLGKDEAGTTFDQKAPQVPAKAAPLPQPDELLLESEENGHEVDPDDIAGAAGAVTDTPKIALILDDGGYGGSVTEKILALDPKLTLAILPHTPAADITAEQAAAKGFEILLHMPMETSSAAVKPFPGQLDTDMDLDRIQELTDQALSQIPHIKGVNNHTGSKFLAEQDRVVPFLKMLKEKDLFFVDSRTRSDSLGYDAALSLGVPAAQRDVFLDNDNDVQQIKKQWDKLIATARKRGTAVGIGHFRDNTVEVLAEKLGDLESAGVELVHVSELLQ